MRAHKDINTKTELMNIVGLGRILKRGIVAYLFLGDGEIDVRSFLAVPVFGVGGPQEAALAPTRCFSPFGAC
jgi:hypothetical protein